MSAACCAPAPLKQARASANAARSPPTRSRRVEDREIEKIIKRQEDIGLQAVTDGEFRRAFWNYDFLGAPRRRRSLSRRAQDQVPGSQPEADDAARHRQARHVFRPSDARAFQVRQGAHARDAEDDDPVAVVLAFPLRPRRRAGDDLSRHGRFLPRSRPDLPQSRARLRRRRLPLSAARRGQLHLSVRSQAARAGGQPRRRSGAAAADLCRA